MFFFLPFLPFPHYERTKHGQTPSLFPDRDAEGFPAILTSQWCKALFQRNGSVLSRHVGGVNERRGIHVPNWGVHNTGWGGDVPSAFLPERLSSLRLLLVCCHGNGLVVKNTQTAGRTPARPLQLPREALNLLNHFFIIYAMRITMLVSQGGCEN